MEKPSILTSKIIYINEKTKQGFFGYKFLDNKIENEFIIFNSSNNKLVKIFMHFYYISYFLYKNIFLKSNLNVYFYMIQILISIINLILIILFHSLKPLKYKLICEKINAFLVIIFQGICIYDKLFLQDTLSNNNLVRSLYNMHFVTIVEMIINFDSSIFLTILLI